MIIITWRNHSIVRAVAALAITCLALGCAAHERRAGQRPAMTSFSLVAPGAGSVALVGSFNQWDRDRHRLDGPDRAGRWTISIPLLPGRHEYLFLVDGSIWVPDTTAPVVDDGMGGRNSVVIVGAQ